MNPADQSPAVELTEHERIGPGRFDHIDPHVDTLDVLRRQAMGAAVIGDPFRPQADDDF